MDYQPLNNTNAALVPRRTTRSAVRAGDRRTSAAARCTAGTAGCRRPSRNTGAPSSFIRTTPTIATGWGTVTPRRDFLQYAIVELEMASSLSPDDGFYHFWLGDLYARAGRHRDAISELEQAAHSAPEDAYYKVRLGVVYMQAGRLHEAVGALRIAVDLAPGNASYHCLLGDTYVRLGYEREALLQYRHAGQLDPYDFDYIERVRRIGAPEAA